MSHTEPTDKKKEETTLIGLLSAKEDDRRHDELVYLLDKLCAAGGSRDLLRRYSFVMTGGTYNRLIDPDPDNPEDKVKGSERDGVNEATKEFLLDKCGILRLPHHRDGGVVLLAYLVVQRRVGIFWQFLTPTNPHWILPENVALMRLCDYWHVNRLLNPHAIEKWVERRALRDAKWNSQKFPLEGLEIESLKKPTPNENLYIIPPRPKGDAWMFDLPSPRKGINIDRYGENTRAALIAQVPASRRLHPNSGRRSTLTCQDRKVVTSRLLPRSCSGSSMSSSSLSTRFTLILTQTTFAPCSARQ